MKKQIAIYDMDRTITRTATYTPFLVHASLRLAPWRLMLAPLLLLPAFAYGVKLIDRKRLKEISHALMIGRNIASDKLAPIIESFADKQITTNVLPGALASIEADKAAGRHLVMATASYSFYAGAIAARLGFADVIATEAQVGKEGKIIAKITGSNCYGDAKLAMIEAWMAREGLNRSGVHVRFYSDHISDSPTHYWSDEPVAANPHKRLIRLALAEGWKVIDWNKKKT